MKYLTYYLVFISIISFFMYFVDKIKAKRKKTRISERTLFVLSFIGGCIGSIMGMFIFNHKVKKVNFYICNFVSLGLWFYIIYMVTK